MVRCVNIDWFQVYGSLVDASGLMIILRNKGYKITEHEQTTRHFSRWISVTRPCENFIYAEITYLPFSLKRNGGIFNDNAAIIKLANRYCYEPNAIENFSQFTADISFSMISISRIDLCLDFEYFDNRMSPRTLIKGFFECLYWKMRPTKCSSVQVQRTDMDYSYISFGDGKTPVRTKLYNKSLEMREVKNKPYIEEMWHNVGIGQKRDVWRLEISVMNDRKELINKGSGELSMIKISNIRTKDEQLKTFFRYQQHYFKFKVNDGKTKKKNAKLLCLFNVSDDDKNFSPLRMCPGEESGRTEKMMLNKLDDLLNSTELSEEAKGDIRRTMFHISTIKRIKISSIKQIKNKKND